MAGTVIGIQIGIEITIVGIDTTMTGIEEEAGILVGRGGAVEGNTIPTLLGDPFLLLLGTGLLHLHPPLLMMRSPPHLPLPRLLPVPGLPLLRQRV